MPVTNADGGIKAGTVAHFANSTAPDGWIKANGALVSRATYAALFTAIGTVYGVGDGATTFGLPDLRGEFVRSLDDGRGIDSGRAIGTAQAGQMQSHTHNNYSSNNNLVGAYPFAQYTDPTVVYTHTTSAAGGTSNASENRPRNVAMLACIKY